MISLTIWLFLSVLTLSSINYDKTITRILLSLDRMWTVPLQYTLPSDVRIVAALRFKKILTGFNTRTYSRIEPGAHHATYYIPVQLILLTAINNS